MKKLSLLTIVLVLLQSTMVAQSLSDNMLQLVNWMTGEFSSAEQSKADTSFYDIELKMVRIWPDQPNGAWLYVEQAAAATPEKPYRQRIYFLAETADDEFSSDVYMLPNQEKYIGAWRDPSLLDDLDPFKLDYKPGCAVFLFFDGFQYSGKTNAQSCKSELKGATYATSEVIITEGEIQTLDRGFDASANQVWGSKSGHYTFNKLR